VTEERTDPEVERVLGDLVLEIRRQVTGLGSLGVRTETLARLVATQRVNPHLPIGWPVMPKGLAPRLRAYAKKVTRVLLRWYINPLVAQQNEYNAAATLALEEFDGRLRQIEERVLWLEERLKTLPVPADESQT
jgi:hypothetical protein